MSEAYKQQFEDGTMVPSDLYCNIGIETEKDRQVTIKNLVSALGMPLVPGSESDKTYKEKNPDDRIIVRADLPCMVGHMRNCNFVCNLITISLVLLRNVYVYQGDHRMGDTVLPIPDLKKCNCGRPGGTKQLETGKYRVFNYPEFPLKPSAEHLGRSSIEASVEMYDCSSAVLRVHRAKHETGEEYIDISISSRRSRKNMTFNKADALILLRELERILN